MVYLSIYIWVICAVNVGKSTVHAWYRYDIYLEPQKTCIFHGSLVVKQAFSSCTDLEILWSPTVLKKWMAINFSHDVKKEQIRNLYHSLAQYRKKQYVRHSKKNMFIYL